MDTVLNLLDLDKCDKAIFCISVTKYEKVELVGRGSFGEAWKIKLVNTGREFILKTLHVRGRTQEDMKRGENEMKSKP